MRLLLIGFTLCTLRAQSPLIDSAQSSVYMRFAKAGRCASSRASANEERIWLTLTNNTRWNVSVLANGVVDKCHGDASPFYDVEATGAMAPDGPIPVGHWFDVASRVEIQPGRTLRFSIPRSHLAPGLAIRVDFEFDWETNNRYTRHSSHFTYWDLPEKLHDKDGEKKLKCRGLCMSGPTFPVQPERSKIPVFLDPPPEVKPR